MSLKQSALFGYSESAQSSRAHAKKKRHKPKRWDQVTPSYPPSKNLSLTLGPDHKSTLSGFEPGYPEFQHLTAQHCNQSTTHFRSAIVIFRLIEAARCKKFFSLQGFPHVSDNTATKGTVCLGGQGHNPGDWEAVRRKIGPPNCWDFFAELGGWLPLVALDTRACRPLRPPLVLGKGVRRGMGSTSPSADAVFALLWRPFFSMFRHPLCILCLLFLSGCTVLRSPGMR